MTDDFDDPWKPPGVDPQTPPAPDTATPADPVAAPAAQPHPQPEPAAPPPPDGVPTFPSRNPHGSPPSDRPLPPAPRPAEHVPRPTAHVPPEAVTPPAAPAPVTPPAAPAPVTPPAAPAPVTPPAAPVTPSAAPVAPSAATAPTAPTWTPGPPKPGAAAAPLPPTAIGTWANSDHGGPAPHVHYGEVKVGARRRFVEGRARLGVGAVLLAGTVAPWYIARVPQVTEWVTAWSFDDVYEGKIIGFRPMILAAGITALLALIVAVFRPPFRPLGALTALGGLAVAAAAIYNIVQGWGRARGVDIYGGPGLAFAALGGLFCLSGGIRAAATLR